MSQHQTPEQHSSQIRALNDELRKSPVQPNGLLAITAGLDSLDDEQLAAILLKVSQYDGFTAENDPHGEHSFGAFEHEGTAYFWLIDYYDLEQRYRSPDPANREVTTRCLTIKRADEH